MTLTESLINASEALRESQKLADARGDKKTADELFELGGMVAVLIARAVLAAPAVHTGSVQS